MALKPGRRDFLWMLSGASVLLILMLVLFWLRNDSNSVQQLESKARRIDIIEQMETSLAKASDAEKRAVLATTDQDSQVYADEARAVTGEMNRQDKELTELLASNGNRGETELLEQFNQAFLKYQEIDREVLVLAVKNTNLKAYALAFGPAAQAVKDLDEALMRVVDKNGTAAAAMAITHHAFGAQAAALKIQALIPPHIAEEDDKKMDEIEAAMAAQDKQAREDLAALKKTQGLDGDPDLQAAAAAYDRFTALRTQILALSRENTNVRSLAISLNQKRKVTIACEDALAALKEKLLAEPIAGVNYGHAANPR